jgi:hypothetical protein
VNFDFFISKILRSKQLRFCQIPLIQTGYILRDRVKSYRCIHILAPEQLRALVDSGEAHGLSF